MINSINICLLLAEIDFGLYIESALKTVFIYFFLITIMRVMGKREMAQISMFDVVVFFIISELLSLAINSRESTLMEAVIPILIIVVLEIITSIIILRYHKMRNLIEGKINYLIYNGVIDQKAMKKSRYNLDDLMSELRSNQVSSPREVQFALLEAKGNLTIVTYKDSKVALPDPLISDGVINKSALKKINKDEQWLKEQLALRNHERAEDIFLLILENTGFYIIPKEHE